MSSELLAWVKYQYALFYMVTLPNVDKYPSLADHSVRPFGYLITYLPFKKPQYGRNHLSCLVNFAAKLSKICIFTWIHLFGSHFLWNLLSFKCWYRNQTSVSDYFLTRSGINDSDYKHLQNSKLWNWKSQKFLEDNLELLLCSVNERQQKYTVLGLSVLPMGFTEKFCLYKYWIKIWNRFALINPSMGSKTLEKGKLNGSRWESADAHSHAGIPVGTGVSELWDWSAGDGLINWLLCS